ncbi:MAG: hypothetical protein AAB880_02895 [Patescibacteria group bacterium]
MLGLFEKYNFIYNIGRTVLVLFVIFVAFGVAQLAIKFFIGERVEKSYKFILAVIIFIVSFLGVVFLFVGTPKEFESFYNWLR